MYVYFCQSFLGYLNPTGRAKLCLNAFCRKTWKFESSLVQRVALLTSSHMGLEYEFPVTRLLPASESSVTQTLPCCWALARRNLKGLLQVLTVKDSYPINWDHCCSDLVYFHRNSWAESLPRDNSRDFSCWIIKWQQPLPGYNPRLPHTGRSFRLCRHSDLTRSFCPRLPQELMVWCSEFHAKYRI